MKEQKRLPFMGFPTERYFDTHYIVNFGKASVGVTWRNGNYQIHVWGVFPTAPSRWAPDELTALAILYDLQNTFGGNDDAVPAIRP